MNTGYAALGVLIALILVSALGYWQGDKHATEAGEAVMDQHLRLDAEAERAAQENARATEQKLAEAQNNISGSYEKGKSDAELESKRITVELRTGALKLQRYWASCETQRLSEAAASASEPDAETRNREESAGRIVRAAAQCDAQVRGLQELIIIERK